MNGPNVASREVENAMLAKHTGEKSSLIRKSGGYTTYVVNILGCMREDQRDHLYSKFGEAYSTYRKVVAGWIMDVGEYFSLHPTTTHAAIAYLDRLQLSKFSRHEWQMLAISCILISAKYNEAEEDVPDLHTLENIVKQPISNEILLKYEMWALQKMGWKLHAYTPLAFIACYVVCGVSHPTDVCWDATSSSLVSTELLDQKISENSYAMASYALLEVQLKPFRASDVACAILYTVRRSLGVVPIWSNELSVLTKTSPEEDGFAAALSMFDSLMPPLISSTSMASSAVSSASSSPSSSYSIASESSVKTTDFVSNPDQHSAPVNQQESSQNVGNIDTKITSGIASLTVADGVSTPGLPTSTSTPSTSSASSSSSGVYSPVAASNRTQHENLCTPQDDKENNYKGKGGLVIPSPISVIAMESLEDVH